MEANGIVLSPDPRLRQECAVIEEITPAIEALAEKMKKMMFENAGCGLAAPQIGELIQLVTIDCDYSDKNDYDPYVLINPVIVEQSDHLVPFSEGCLSIPGISCEIERPDHVVVEAYDLDANLIRYEATGDLFCVCLQHEIDHLHGNTMFERLKPMQDAIHMRGDRYMAAQMRKISVFDQKINLCTRLTICIRQEVMYMACVTKCL